MSVRSIACSPNGLVGFPCVLRFSPTPHQHACIQIMLNRNECVNMHTWSPVMSSLTVQVYSTSLQPVLPKADSRSTLTLTRLKMNELLNFFVVVCFTFYTNSFFLINCAGVQGEKINMSHDSVIHEHLKGNLKSTNFLTNTNVTTKAHWIMYEILKLAYNIPCPL